MGKSDQVTVTDEEAKRHRSWRRRFRRWRRAKFASPHDSMDVVQHFERRKALRDRVIEHAPSLMTAAIFAFVCLKVLLISHSNVTTALAVVKEAGPIQVIAGVLILTLPFLGVGFVNAAGILARTGEIDRFERRRLWWYYGVAAFVLSFVLPIRTTILIAIFPFISIFLWRKERIQSGTVRTLTWEELAQSNPVDIVMRKIVTEGKKLVEEQDALQAGSGTVDAGRQRQITTELTRLSHEYNARSKMVNEARGVRLDILAVSLLITTLAPVALNALNARPWLPAEHIVLENGEDLVGYVASSKDDWAAILLEEPRIIVNHPLDEIVSRKTCVMVDSLNSKDTLWSFSVESKPQYPECPDT